MGDSYATYGDDGMEIEMDLDDLGKVEMKQRGDRTKAQIKIRPIDVEIEGEMRPDYTSVEVELDELDRMRINGTMVDEQITVNVRGGKGDYNITGTFDDQYEGTQISSEMKFDKFFLYGMDNIDAKDNSAPGCGPSNGGKDPCKDITGSENTCCTHVVMTDQGNGKQTSFYRCMNEKILDMSFQVEIDGMMMAMGCSDGYSTAKYIAGSLIASTATLAAMTLFWEQR